MQKQFSDEFKKAAVARVQNGETQVEVARSLHISSKTLSRWCIQSKEMLSPEENSLIEENARLRKALKQREAEVEFLKKSLEPSWLSSRIKIIKFHAVQFLLSARREPHRKSYPLFRSAHLN